MTDVPTTMTWTEVESQWWERRPIGSVRGPKSWRGGGWYFLAEWLPNEREFDIGPFKTKQAAIAEAERLYRERGV